MEGGTRVDIPVDLQYDYRRPGTRVARPYETIRGGNQCVGLRDRWTAWSARLGREVIPRCILF